MIYIYTVDIYIKRKGLLELYDSNDIVTDRLYTIIPYKEYKYNKDITFIKYTTLTYGNQEEGYTRGETFRRNKGSSKRRKEKSKIKN